MSDTLYVVAENDRLTNLNLVFINYMLPCCMSIVGIAIVLAIGENINILLLNKMDGRRRKLPIDHLKEHVDTMQATLDGPEKMDKAFSEVEVEKRLKDEMNKTLDAMPPAFIVWAVSLFGGWWYHWSSCTHPFAMATLTAFFSVAPFTFPWICALLTVVVVMVLSRRVRSFDALRRTVRRMATSSYSSLLYIPYDEGQDVA